jgi:hypothetical protein
MKTPVKARTAGTSPKRVQRASANQLGKLITSHKPILAWLFLAGLVGFVTFVTWAWK